MLRRFGLAVLLVSMGLHADTLRLRSGATVEGTYLGGSTTEIRFLAGNAVRYYAIVDVTAVVFGSGDSAGAAPATPSVEFGPDIAGEPMLRGASGYIPLERVTATMSRNAGMIGPPLTTYRIPGARSPVRLRPEDPMVFVVRLDNGGSAGVFQLYRLESKKGYRQTQPVGGGLPPALPMKVTRVGPGIYEIAPGQALAPGEYAISPTNSNRSYCFGLEP